MKTVPPNTISDTDSSPLIPPEVEHTTCPYERHCAVLWRNIVFLLQIEDQVSSGLWVGDCFIYSNASWRLNYCVGGEVTVMFHLDRALYLLGYIATQQRVYLIDREYSIVSYTLLLALVEFKTLVMRGMMDDAFELLETLPENQLDGCACLFLLVGVRPKCKLARTLKQVS